RRTGRRHQSEIASGVTIASKIIKRLKFQQLLRRANVPQTQMAVPEAVREQLRAGPIEQKLPRDAAMRIDHRFRTSMNIPENNPLAVAPDREIVAAGMPGETRSCGWRRQLT